MHTASTSPRLAKKYSTVTEKFMATAIQPNRLSIDTKSLYNIREARCLWLPLMDTLRTLEFDLKDEEALRKLIQSAEGYSNQS